LNYDVIEKLDKLWRSSGAWPEYIQVMRQAFEGRQVEPQATFIHLSGLPNLCCQAAGGEPNWADDLTLAWHLFYAAAQLMDSVQDGDDPNAWWAEQGVGVALSAASGLYFSASMALNHLIHQLSTSEQAIEIAEDFFRTFLVMGSGQHADLTRPSMTLEQYWQQAETKSGAFFSLACRAGAHLACNETAILQEYSKFGMHLGLLIQISDDLDDVQPPQGSSIPGQKLAFARSLPVVYALEVSPPQQAARLRECLKAASYSSKDAQEVVSLVDQCGAAEYVMVELVRHKTEALAALERAATRSPAGDALSGLVQGFSLDTAATFGGDAGALCRSNPQFY